jgi:hypothetical protein
LRWLDQAPQLETKALEFKEMPYAALSLPSLRKELGSPRNHRSLESESKTTHLASSFTDTRTLSKAAHHKIIILQAAVPHGYQRAKFFWGRNKYF